VLARTAATRMSNASSARPGPTETDMLAVEKLKRDIATGKQTPPEVRLREQLEQMFSRWHAFCRK
jgi:hypothetical protein